MSHTYGAVAITNNILKRSFDEKQPITLMKTQRVLYFVAAYNAYLSQQNGLSPRLLDEDFQAWAYGPVIPSVYYMFKSYGRHPIRKFAPDAKGQRFIAAENSDPLLRLSVAIFAT